MAADPYCGNCGYSFKGLTESARCPECGKPVVEVLQRGKTLFRGGKRYKSDIVIFGLPLVHIALGPSDDELRGKARGVIAIGDTAVGWLAIGGGACGFIAIGGMAIGLVSIGGMSLGLLAAIGGMAVGGLALGGGAVGGIANGGGAIGFVAEGGGALGVYARGGGVWATHGIGMGQRDPEAVRVFSEWAWLIGRPSILGMNWTMIGWIATVILSVAAVCAVVATIAYYSGRAREQTA